MTEIRILSSNTTYVEILNALTALSEYVLLPPSGSEYTTHFTYGDDIEIEAHGNKTVSVYDYGYVTTESHSTGYKDYIFRKDGEIIAKAEFFIGVSASGPYPSFSPREVAKAEADGDMFAAEEHLAVNLPGLNFISLGNVQQVIKPGAVFGDGYKLDFSGSEVFKLGGGNDTAYGAGGPDQIFGNSGNDQLFGGSGSDSLDGGRGDDKLDGGPGQDRLIGGPGKDLLVGGASRDRLGGGTGNDRLDGGASRDRLYGDKGRDKIIYAKGYGSDTFTDFTDKKDTIVLDNNLWKGKMTIRKVLDTFGKQKGDDFVLKFNDSDKLIVENTQKAELYHDVQIV